MILSRLKFILLNLKISMIKIFVLEEKDGRIKLKLDKIKKILSWPVPQDQIVVKTFFSTIQSIYYWIFELICFLIRFTRKVD